MGLYFLTRMIKPLCTFRLLIIKILCNYTSPYLSSDKIKPGIKAKVLLYLILTACIIPVYGQESHPCADTCATNGNNLIHRQFSEKKHPGHSQIVYFRFDQARVDSGFAGNRDGLQVLKTLFSDSARVSLIDSIHIYAFASPEGRESYNDRLAASRAVSMKEYLMGHHPLLEHCPINLFPQGENWEGMRELILRDKGFDEWQEVIMILDKVQDSYKRERLIKRLNGGKAYAYIKEHILPPLRNAAVCTFLVYDRKLSIPLSKLSIPLLRGVGGMLSYS